MWCVCGGWGGGGGGRGGWESKREASGCEIVCVCVCVGGGGGVEIVTDMLNQTHNRFKRTFIYFDTDTVKRFKSIKK